MTNAENVSFLLAFLSILVHRAGGTLVIENLSEMAGSISSVSMELDPENDKVTLTSNFRKVGSSHYREN